ncbi:hypothetical protein CLV67_13772 [Actinoplanes italicus]|uniref:Uncharacterized protein n=1 Tax=Actinoplanes italicus TaxID=113567 RepID=A0A2T0JNL1_9ACTN|nr:hypothetical protein CLV67_13772 [Actinoplanes italicus]
MSRHGPAPCIRDMPFPSAVGAGWPLKRGRRSIGPGPAACAGGQRPPASPQGPTRHLLRSGSGWGWWGQSCPGPLDRPAVAGEPFPTPPDRPAVAGEPFPRPPDRPAVPGEPFPGLLIVQPRPVNPSPGRLIAQPCPANPSPVRRQRYPGARLRKRPYLIVQHPSAAVTDPHDPGAHDRNAKPSADRTSPRLRRVRLTGREPRRRKLPRKGAFAVRERPASRSSAVEAGRQRRAAGSLDRLEERGLIGAPESAAVQGRWCGGGITRSSYARPCRRDGDGRRPRTRKRGTPPLLPTTSGAHAKPGCVPQP